MAAKERKDKNSSRGEWKEERNFLSTEGDTSCTQMLMRGIISASFLRAFRRKSLRGAVVCKLLQRNERARMGSEQGEVVTDRELSPTKPLSGVGFLARSVRERQKEGQRIQPK